MKCVVFIAVVWVLKQMLFQEVKWTLQAVYLEFSYSVQILKVRYTT